MAIKKFFKDIFIVEYDEEESVEENKPKQQNSKVTQLDQSKKKKVNEGSGEPRQMEQGSAPVSPSFRKKDRRSGEPRHQKKQSNTRDKETTLMSAEASNTKVCLFEPRVFSETQDIADELKNERAALVNLSKVDHSQKKRIVDFLSGTVYALDGDIQKVGADIFLCTPNSVGVKGEISQEKNQTEEM
ncbi:cell division protein SepF [Salinicoccus jeotgali]|uniref:Cell division protein SepF n=1 Tax=Salinicoccus jeotgali TaxID=381634 RepID=A0ABP7EFJ4_9STAP